jgi:hypothetical protein
VTDAGDPVAGARVTVAGKTRTTAGNGEISLDLPAGQHVATAAKRGYTGASARVLSA